MINLKVLDVAIGTAFFFVFASLICSAVREVIEGFQRQRAKMMERALRELLDEKSGAPGNVVAEFYNHPLIDSLFSGDYSPNSDNLPAYIPAKHFAAALLDLVAPANLVLANATAANAAAKAAAAKAAAANATIASATAASAATAGTVAGANVPAEDARPGLGAWLDDAKFTAVLEKALQPASKAGAGAASLVIGENLKRALLWALESSDGDINKARQALESWYDNSMERVTGWYKHQTQIWLLIIGFVLAALLNLNALRVIDRLYADDEFRNAVVADAARASEDSKWAVRHGIELAQAEQGAPVATSETPTPAPAESTSPADVKPQGEAGAAKLKGAKVETAKPPQVAAPSPAPSPNPAAKSPAEAELIASALAVMKTTKTSVDTSMAEMDKLGYPIGWSEQSWKDFTRAFSAEKYRLVLESLAGWLITALATTLGAAFWFDLLNKLVSLRTSLKPKDDSEKKSKKSKKSEEAATNA